MKVGPGAACLVVAGLVALLIWAIARGRKGYNTVQALFARLDAEANATATAQASNNVRVQVGRYGDEDELDEYAEVLRARRVIARHQARQQLVADDGFDELALLADEQVEFPCPPFRREIRRSSQ